MIRQPHRKSAVLASMLLSWVACPANAAPAPEPIDMGFTANGHISVDAASVKTRSGRRTGWKQVQATIELDQPVHYAAREITQEVQTQDWDCPDARYRVILRVFRTNDGGFVRSERKISSWMSVPKEGAGRATFELLCPKAAISSGDG